MKFRVGPWHISKEGPRAFWVPIIFTPQSLSIMSPWTAETEALEKTPLLDSERSSRHVCYTRKGVRHDSSDSSMNSRFESGPSCSRPPIYRRSFSAETLLSSADNLKESDFSNQRTSSDSPNLHCIYPQQNPPLLSKSGPFCNVWNWVELRLENSGSVARDHLASERTFLAYTRTSLAIASSGVGESPLFCFGAYWGLTVSFFYVALVFSTASAASWQKLHVYIRLLGASTIILSLFVLFIGLSSSPCEMTLISFIYFSYFA